MASGPGLSPSTSTSSISSISSVSSTISTSTSSSTTSSHVIDNGTGAPTSGSGTMAKYKMIKKIGQGNFGVVFLAEWAEDHKIYVVKQIDMAQLSPTERDGAVQETKLLASLRHPYIVGYQESFVEKDLLNIVMQYCDGGDLASRIRAQAAMRAPSASAMVSSSVGSTSSTTASSMAGVSSTTPAPVGTALTSPNNGGGEPVHFAEEQILDWFVQIAVALKHCHNHKIIHRDLKSQNVFLTRSNEVRLGDFGIARVLGGTTEMAMTVVGTPYSMSPEVCENKPYSFKSDVWALGCVLYEMCVLKHAFDAHNLLGLVWKIVQESYPPIPASYSDDLRGLIKLLLQKDPRQRPSIDEILDIPFVRMRLNAQIASKTSLVNNSRKAGTLRKGQFKPAALGLTHSTSTPLSSAAPTPTPSVASSNNGSLGTLAFAGPVGSSNGASTPLHSTMLTSTFGSLHGTLAPLSGTVVGTTASMSNATMGPNGTRRAGTVPPINPSAASSHHGGTHLPAIDSPNPGEVTEMIEVDDFDDRDEFGPAQGHHSGPILSGPILDESESPSSHLDFNEASPQGGMLSTAAFGSGSLLVTGGNHGTMRQSSSGVAASHNGAAGMNDTMAFSTTTTFRPDSVSAPARDNYTLGGTMMAGAATSAIEEDMEFDDGPSHVGGHLAGTVRTGAPTMTNINNAPSPTTMPGGMSTLSPAMSPTGSSQPQQPQQQPAVGGTPRAGADGFVLPRLASPRNAADFEMIPRKVSQQQRLAEMARRKADANARREAELAAARQQNFAASSTKRLGPSGRGTTPTAANTMNSSGTASALGYGGNRPQPITAGMNTTDEFPSVPVSPHSAPVAIARTSSGTRTGGTAPSTPSHMSGSGLVYANPTSTGPSPKKMFDSRPNTTARHPAVAAAQASNDPNRHRSAGSTRTGPRGSVSGASGGNGNASISQPLPSSALPSPSSGRLPATRTSRSPSWENTPIRSSGRYVYPDEQAYNYGRESSSGNGNNHHPELYDTMGSNAASEYAADFEEEHYTDPSVQEAQDQLAAMQRAARHTALVPVKGAAPITPHSQPVSAFGFDDSFAPNNNGSAGGMPTPSMPSREEKVLTPFETKCAAMKTKVLKSISEAQFEEIYKHFAEGFDGRSGITKQQLIDKWHLKDDVLMNIEQMVYMDAMRGPSKPSLPASAPTPKSGPVQSPTRISPPTPSRGDRNPANNGNNNNNNGILGPSPTRPGTHARTSVTGSGARPTSGQPARGNEIPRDNIPVGNAASPPPEYVSPDDRPIRRSTSTDYAPNGSAVFTFGSIPTAGPTTASSSSSSGTSSGSSSRSSNPDDRPLGTARGTGSTVRKGTGTGGGASSIAKKKSTIATASDRSLFSSSGAIGGGGNDRKGTDSATNSLRGISARRKPALDTGAGHR